MSTPTPEPMCNERGVPESECPPHCKHGMTCTDPHVTACPKCVRNVEEPTYLVRVEGGCDAAYVCTDCKYAWDVAWGCAK